MVFLCELSGILFLCGLNFLNSFAYGAAHVGVRGSKFFFEPGHGRGGFFVGQGLGRVAHYSEIPVIQQADECFRGLGIIELPQGLCGKGADSGVVVFEILEPAFERVLGVSHCVPSVV